MSGRVLYEFNTKNNTKSWNINAYTISSISGDDLILQVGSNGNLKIEGNIIPSLSENYDLGDNNNKLRYIYANQINADVSGNASTCTKLQESVKIGGVDFTGENGINLPGVNMIGNQDTTGNAATATRFKTKLVLGGIEWDGSHDISLAGVNSIGDQDTRGNAATATRFQNNIKIGGVPFDGTTSIDLPGVNTTGRVGTYGIALNAIGLYYKPTIGGVLFDGSSNIDLPGVNIAGTQDTSGTADSAISARRADALMMDGSYANILIREDDIYYNGLNHIFGGPINCSTITELKQKVESLENENVLMKNKLNTLLTLQEISLPPQSGVPFPPFPPLQ